MDKSCLLCFYDTAMNFRFFWQESETLLNDAPLGTT